MTGTLGLFSLVDLFQLLAASSRSGRLTVDHPQGAARVYFEEGLAVHAEFSGFSGEEAVFALFSDEQGSFEFMLGVPAPQATIETSTENLMLEATRRLDESRRGDGPSSAGAEPPALAVDEPELLDEATPAADPGPAVREDDPSEAARAKPAPEPQTATSTARPEPAPEPTEDALSPSSVTGSGSAPPSGKGVPLTAVPAFAEKARTVADMSLSKEEVVLLRGVDGRRNVAAVAREAGVAEETARSTVQRFVDAGVLRLFSQKPRTARLVTQLTGVRLPHGVAGVDTSIMSSWEKSLGYKAQSVACRLEDGRVCLLGAMPLDNAGPYLLINRETLLHADLAVNQPLLVKPVPQSAG